MTLRPSRKTTAVHIEADLRRLYSPRRRTKARVCYGIIFSTFVVEPQTVLTRAIRVGGKKSMTLLSYISLE
ncbi:hypothetical protein Y032_0593g409 [Ancylostoma ceylanicum]|uniref:Uncharacterized protein n=1 Tax=Ancylostoma ceylanicum TaxID=53326 RepID=A0A016WNL6_9BILA|nr:hypothetical protein Y032_0593g409 [Ancylostoma ceylanicum]